MVIGHKVADQMKQQRFDLLQDRGMTVIDHIMIRNVPFHGRACSIRGAEDCLRGDASSEEEVVEAPVEQGVGLAAVQRGVAGRASIASFVKPGFPSAVQARSCGPGAPTLPSTGQAARNLTSHGRKYFSYLLKFQVCFAVLGDAGTRCCRNGPEAAGSCRGPPAQHVTHWSRPAHQSTERSKSGCSVHARSAERLGRREISPSQKDICWSLPQPETSVRTA